MHKVEKSTSPDSAQLKTRFKTPSALTLKFHLSNPLQLRTTAINPTFLPLDWTFFRPQSKQLLREMIAGFFAANPHDIGGTELREKAKVPMLQKHVIRFLEHQRQERLAL
ncbi:hypothetical protein HNY73_020182 [Argiope bruennichi]|uniref:Uncharacterized protein n=1 Tax=Argiope bruennichi TaxID=94029 RepID=A0A8T0E6S4_ARGBR|nr:hypothetical protein HNY73_020182 [Argiope bruennichi]